MVNLARLLFAVGLLCAIFGGIWGVKVGSTPDGFTSYYHIGDVNNRAMIVTVLILGVLTGLLYVMALRKTTQFLIASVALLLITLGGAFWLFPLMHVSVGVTRDIINITVYIGLLMGPIAAVVGIKSLLAAGGNEE